MNQPIVVDVERLARVGKPVLSGRIRVAPGDFDVTECLTHRLDGAGEHLWLWVEKTGLTTPQAASRLARVCDMPVRNIGYAGLKDRHAVTRQWFSLPWPIKADLPDWPSSDDLRVLESHRHGRKLKRGAHAGNRFCLRLRDVTYDADFDLDATVARIGHEGVPNYFGAQRFGRGGGNVELARALFAGKRLRRNQSSIALSAARSFLFNTVLDARVAAGTWCQPLPGDVFMLAGTHSVFNGEQGGDSPERLAERVAMQDLHPTGPMPGRTGPRSCVPSEAVAALEAACMAPYADLLEGLGAAGVDADRRALRLTVGDWSVVRDGDDLMARFTLPRGAFATTVLRELGHFVDASRASVSER